MARARASLTRLPVEVLRAIFLQLPSSAALALVRTCRRIHAACDDPDTWRNFVAAQPTLAGAYRAVLGRRTEQGGWRRYVVADALAASQHGALDGKDVENWLPHVIALQRTFSLLQKPRDRHPLR
jgi:hypothetical protein